MSWLADTLRENPELAIFLTLALGFVVGKVQLGSFRVGNVVGTLLAGVIVGQLGVRVDPLVKIVFFDLFLFATGYKVGPQFFRGLGRNALSQAALTAVLCVTSLATTAIFARIMGYDCGTAAGLLAGAFTESTVIGTAGNAIARLDLPEAEKQRLLNNIPVAYAVSYLVGTGFVVWVLSGLGPRLLKVDLRAESRKLEAEVMGSTGVTAESGALAYNEWDVRTYRVHPSLVGRSVSFVEGTFAPARLFVKRVRRGTQVLETVASTVLEAGDHVAVAARRHVLVGGSGSLGEEVQDRELLEYPVGTLDVVLTRREVVDHTLAEVAAEHGRGIVLEKLLRAGEEIPFGPATVLNRGDLLRISGPLQDVERAGRALGYVERPSAETDIVFVGVGIVLGGLLGVLSVTVAGVPLSLTASGGALIMGLVFGWLRSVRPTFGRIPEPALWVFDTVGLAVFIAIVGLNAGPTFVSGLRATGPSLLVVAFVVAMIPHVAAILFGHHVLKMNPVILLGACAGAGTTTAALRAVQDAADSKLPVLGYTVPYALGNILLTAWGPVIVLLTK